MIMKSLLSLLFLFALWLPLRAANIDERALRQDQFTTNLPSAHYIGIKGYGVTNVPGTNIILAPGGSIIFTTNGPQITISTTGLGQATNVAIIPGQDIGVETNGAGTWTIYATNFWHTNAADGSITNINSGNGVASVSGTNSVVVLDNLTSGNRMFLVGQTNGNPSFRLRSDGSMFIGKHVTQDVNVATFSTEYPLWQISMTDSNDPPLVWSQMAVHDNETKTFGGSIISKLTGNKDASRALVTWTAANTNGHSRQMTFDLKEVNGKIELASNGVTAFSVSVNNGDLTGIKGVPYFWPGTNGVANQVLMTDGGIPQQLSWTEFIKALTQGTNIVLVTNGNVITIHSTATATNVNAVSVAAGTNITAVTNGGLVTISVTDTNLPVVVAGTNVTVVTNGLAYTVSSEPAGTTTNAVQTLITNSIPNFIHGTTNYIAKFTPNTNEVGDSIVVETLTNQWEWRSRKFPTAWTNQITNTMYARDSGAGSWDRLELVSASAFGASAYNELNARTTTAGGGSGGNRPLKIFDAWTINHGVTTPSGAPAGFLLPVQDNVFAIGSASQRAQSVWAGPTGFIATDGAAYNDANFGATTYSMCLSASGILFKHNSSGWLAGFALNGTPGISGMVLGPSVLGASATTANFSSDTFLKRGNEAHTWAFQTNNGSAGTPPAAVLEGGEASGTDNQGSDIVILGGRSRGTGRAGSVRVQTVEPASASSATINNNKTDRSYISASAVSLTTNSATLVFNFTVPADQNIVGGRVMATTRITDGTDVASMTETFAIVALRKVNTVTCTNSASVPSAFLGTGSASFVNTWTVVPNAQSVDVKLNTVTTGIASTNSTVRWRFEADSDAVPAITPQ